MAIPERKLILVAVVFAILEKFISTLGKLNFIWATTVLLGGFTPHLARKDFWFVSLILVAEGLRILGLRGELHRSFSLHKIIKLVLLCIQEYSALISAILLYKRLQFSAYGPSDQTRNRNAALILFFWVSMVKSFLVGLGNGLRLFIGIVPLRWFVEARLARRFWAILTNRWVLESNLDDNQITTLYGFLHNTYSRCVTGSIFDVRKITIVSYSVELLQSSDGDEQLKGATLLRGLVEKDPRALERLRSIGTIRSVVDMLIDMLNWDSKNPPDKAIRFQAAMIILYLVEIDRIRTLLMAAPDSMESIASLLYDGNQVEINSRQNRLCMMGLFILCQLANDHDNSAKMGSNRGLLLKIITLTKSNTPDLSLKSLAIFTLTSIALDKESRESIGGTDGVLHNFFSLFFRNFNIDNNDEKELVSKAGEALGFLSLENDHNCEIMMSINPRPLIQGLIDELNDPVRGTYAARILRNLSAYLEAKSVELEAKSVLLEANRVELEANSVNLNTIRTASAEVVRLVMEKEEAHQEAAIGLAAQILKFPPSPFIFGGEGGFPSLISKLLDVLQQYATPSEELPNIRRFSILLLIAVMKMDIRPTIGNELQRDLINALEGAMNTTSVLESYSTFSGTIGLTSHSMSIPFLAHSAMELLHSEPARRHRS